KGRISPFRGKGGKVWNRRQSLIRPSRCCLVGHVVRGTTRRRRWRAVGREANQVVLQLKSPYKDGTTHVVMSPMEFMESLAALVPGPRLHLIRFHGVLAPNAKLRSKIIPTPPEPAAEPSNDHAPCPPTHRAHVERLSPRREKR